MRAWLTLVFVVGALGFMAGCDLPSGLGTPEGWRSVRGQLILPDSGIVGRQNTGLEMAAVVINDPDEGTAVFASAPFNPAPRTGESTFVLQMPATMACVLVLQVPGQGDAGSYLGVLEFADGLGGTTTLVPAGDDTIDLGNVAAVENDPTTVVDNKLSVDTGHSPLAQVDSDGDGTSDYVDDDDDDDGVGDAQDPDVAGDGVDDTEQLLTALADADADGIPDLLDR